ncbi:MAG TPA: AmmeMemoRadiSam system protein A [Candidatus Aminicenantes bacterium]|nr:AmmeMemoRadiSam system protein A [Candidatus Aminicenantes bacterium]
MPSALSASQKKFLLDLARQAIEHYLKEKKTISIVPEDKELNQKRGAFVTLKNRDQLRGCIGYPLPLKPLYQTIIDAAIAAATQDYRFPPLTLPELQQIKIEISVLTLPRRVKDPQEIEVGRHGLIISKGFHKGLLLPQVPGEWGWDRETFLRHTCLKAGLAEDEWQKGATIEVFEAEVFAED